MYVVITPETGDMRRFEEEGDPETALVRAIASTQPGDVVALIRRGSIARVWTAPSGPEPSGASAASPNV